MGSEKIRVSVPMLAKELRRARDVRKEERDGAAREILSHVETIIPRDRAPVYIGSGERMVCCASIPE